jgi:hypothetical protein
MMTGLITQNVETELLLFTIKPITQPPNQHTDSLLITVLTKIAILTNIDLLV